MYVIVFRAWNGNRCEIRYTEEDAKKRFEELELCYAESIQRKDVIEIILK